MLDVDHEVALVQVPEAGRHGVLDPGRPGALADALAQDLLVGHQRHAAVAVDEAARQSPGTRWAWTAGSQSGAELARAAPAWIRTASRRSSSRRRSRSAAEGRGWRPPRSRRGSASPASRRTSGDERALVAVGLLDLAADGAGVAEGEAQRLARCPSRPGGGAGPAARRRAPARPRRGGSGPRAGGPARRAGARRRARARAPPSSSESACETRVRVVDEAGGSRRAGSRSSVPRPPGWKPGSSASIPKNGVPESMASSTSRTLEVGRSTCSASVAHRAPAPPPCPSAVKSTSRAGTTQQLRDVGGDPLRARARRRARSRPRRRRARAGPAAPRPGSRRRRCRPAPRRCPGPRPAGRARSPSSTSRAASASRSSSTPLPRSSSWRPSSARGTCRRASAAGRDHHRPDLGRRRGGAAPAPRAAPSPRRGRARGRRRAGRRRRGPTTQAIRPPAPRKKARSRGERVGLVLVGGHARGPARARPGPAREEVADERGRGRRRQAGDVGAAGPRARRRTRRASGGGRPPAPRCWRSGELARRSMRQLSGLPGHGGPVLHTDPDRARGRGACGEITRTGWNRPR